MKVLDPAAFKIRKETILQFSRHLFANKGYTETSMDDIAHACGMQKASLYHYFKNKLQLLRDMIDLEGGRWAAQIEHSASHTNFKDCLLNIGNTFLSSFDDTARREFFQIIHFESHKNPEILKAFKESPIYRRGIIDEVFLNHLEPRMPRKKIAMLVTQFMGGLIHYATLSRLRGENMCLEKFEDGDYVQQLVDATMGVLGNV